jgi:hypothetical protein
MSSNSKKSKKIQSKGKSKSNAPRKKVAFKKPTARDTLLGRVGSALGGAIGGRSAAKLGRMAGNYASRITGLGDYSIQKNVFLNNNGPPVFAGDAEIIVAHREFIGDISGSTSFGFGMVAGINPCNSTLFPWLSQVALQYEEWEPLGMVFEFKSTSADALNSTNTALGTVIMATEYDTLKPLFANKIQMENYEYSTSTKPSESVLHMIECAPQYNPLARMYNYNRGVQPIPPLADPHLYNLGTFQLATTGMQAVAVVGELWVSYRIRLLKPRVSTIPNDIGDTIHLSSLLSDLGTGTTLTQPFGNSAFSISSAGIVGTSAAQKIASGSVTIDLQVTYNPTTNGQLVLTNLNKTQNRAYVVAWGVKTNASSATAGVDWLGTVSGVNAGLNTIFCLSSSRSAIGRWFPQTSSGSTSNPQTGGLYSAYMYTDGTLTIDLASLTTVFAGATSAGFDILITEIPFYLFSAGPPTDEQFARELQICRSIGLAAPSYSDYRAGNGRRMLCSSPARHPRDEEDSDGDVYDEAQQRVVALRRELAKLSS